MFLIIGLGNPGKEYENTRHNIGFLAVDEISRQYNFSSPKSKFQSEISEGTIEGQKVFLQKPLSYMNRSGGPVLQAAQFFKIPLENIIVIHDDIDLVVGKVRVKTGGGNGGHNGLKDIDAKLGKEYKRVRVGVGHPGDRNMVADYVLGRFSKDERILIDGLVDNIAKNITTLLQGRNDLFINQVVGKI